jgi:hypothetical protein
MIMGPFSTIVKTILKRSSYDKITSENSDPPLHDVYLQINHAFLSALVKDSETLMALSENAERSNGLDQIVQFYNDGLKQIQNEINIIIKTDPGFKNRLEEIASWCTNNGQNTNENEIADQVWKVFFPEGVDIFDILS